MHPFENNPNIEYVPACNSRFACSTKRISIDEVNVVVDPCFQKTTGHLKITTGVPNISLKQLELVHVQ